jgi:LPS export ABC transporter protein LptC
MKILAILFGIMLVASGISWGVFALDDHFRSKAEASAPAMPRYVDAHYFNALIIVTDENGLESHRTITPEMLHFSDDTAEAFYPVTLLQRGEEAPWEIRAERATMDNSTKLAFLHDEVIIDRQASPLNDAVHIVSRDVALDFNTNFAHSAAFTTMLSGQQFTSGTGMDAWFTEPARIQLLADVKSILTP